MRPAKRAAVTVALLLGVGALVFIGVTVWERHQQSTLYIGQWVLSVDRMVSAMVDRGTPMSQVRAFYESNRGGSSRLEVFRTEVKRVASGRSVVATYRATEVSPACWRMDFAGGTSEHWCIKDRRLSVKTADGKTLEYRREGSGQMVSDSKPLQ